MANQIIANTSGAFGYAADPGHAGYELKTSAAVAAKTVVSIGTTGLIATSATNGTASLCVGFAVAAIASGATGQVLINGYLAGVPCDGAIAAGDIVIRSGTTAGSVKASATPAAGEALGTAIAASASNTCTVLVARSL
jgi:hypothetical protein